MIVKCPNHSRIRRLCVLGVPLVLTLANLAIGGEQPEHTSRPSDTEKAA